jgi:acetyl-CoA C-acetyltransferase
MNDTSNIYFASGVRTPFSKVDDALAAYDPIELSVPVVQAMAERLKPGTRPDLAVWGSVVANLG